MKLLKMSVLVLVVFALCAEISSFAGNSFPASLPVGNTNVFRNYILGANPALRTNGNKVLYSMQLYYTNSTGVSASSTITANNIQPFADYDQYTRYAASNAVYLRNNILSQGNYEIASPVHFSAPVLYQYGQSFIYGISTDISFSDLNQISSNGIRRSMFQLPSQIEEAVIPITGLQGYRYTFLVDGVDYTHAWGTLNTPDTIAPRSFQFPPGITIERTTTNLFVIPAMLGEGKYFGAFEIDVAGLGVARYDWQGHRMLGKGAVSFRTTPEQGDGTAVLDVINTSGTVMDFTVQQYVQRPEIPGQNWQTIAVMSGLNMLDISEIQLDTLSDVRIYRVPELK